MGKTNRFVVVALCLGSLPSCQQSPDERGLKNAQAGIPEQSRGAGSAVEGDATASPTIQSGMAQQDVSSDSSHLRDKGAALPSEASFIVANGLSASRISNVVESDDEFRNAIQALEREAATDADAQQINKHYRLSAQAALGDTGRIVALSCGYVLCIGEVGMQGEEAYQRWDSEFGALGSSTPVYSLSEMSVPSESSEQILRFVASIDSEKNSLSTE